jgi:hypothetical protein
MTDLKAREVAVALSQNLISFHKGAPRFGADANEILRNIDEIKCVFSFSVFSL